MPFYVDGDFYIDIDENRWRFPNNYKQGVKKGLLSLTKKSGQVELGALILFPDWSSHRCATLPSQLTRKFEFQDTRCYHGHARGLTPPTPTPWLSNA